MHGLPRPNTYDPGPVRDAYRICLNLEGQPAAPREGPSRVICARYLGFMILEMPHDEGREYLASLIKTCAGEVELVEFARYCIDHLVGCFKVSRRHILDPSTRRPAPDIGDLRFSSVCRAAPPFSYLTAKLKALMRDNYRCVVTLAYDTSCYEAGIPQAVGAVKEGAVKMHTEIAYILPETLVVNLSDANGSGSKYRRALSTILQYFAELDTAINLDSANLHHHLENILTMNPDSHVLFSRLYIWFHEARSYEYTLEAVAPAFLADLPHTVRLSTSDAAHLPPPSPHLLAVHAVCARLAYLSGAGNYVDKVLRDFEHLCVLATDGSSADVLKYALLKAQAAQDVKLRR